MKILTPEQTRILDASTIAADNIRSFDLMKRAATAFVTCFIEYVKSPARVLLLAGPGNNGGDALAVAQILSEIKGFAVKVLMCGEKGRLSADCAENLQLVEMSESIELLDVKALSEALPDTDVIVDGLFGSGLNRRLEGQYKLLIDKVNASNRPIYSIDIPSGLYADKLNDAEDTIVKATVTITFDSPKLSFFMSENEAFTGTIRIMDIGLNEYVKLEFPTPFFATEPSDIHRIKRTKFSHKGTYGHVLVVGGKKGMAGAICMASKAALRSGCGLLTIASVEDNRLIAQSIVPEAMFQDVEDMTSTAAIEKYNSLLIGPGMGTSQDAFLRLELLLEAIGKAGKSCLLDADALNMLALHQRLDLIPQQAVLTPHPKEFERLFGKTDNSYKQLQLALQKAVEYKCVIVLKGAHTRVIMPDGRCYFNMTGNAALAKGGSGDVLGGMIASYLAQGYGCEQAALNGVYFHGLAADQLVKKMNMEAVLPTDIIEELKYI